MAKIADTTYPRFKPVRTYTHDLMGKIKVIDATNAPAHGDGEGAQTDFYHNNAEVDNNKQFSIKLFSTSIEAFAAYQRQAIAAKKRLAPPVGCMVQWKLGRWSRWGYETCRAVTGGHVDVVARVMCNPRARKVYREWMRFRGREDNSFAENRDLFYKESSWDLIYMNNGDMRPLRDLKNDPLVVVEGRDFARPRFNLMNFGVDSNDSTLRTRLEAISVTGTQYDFMWDIHDDGDKSFESNKRLRLGKKWIKSDEATMGKDLHDGNIGLWKGRPVCIDFGFHCVSSRHLDWCDD